MPSIDEVREWQGRTLVDRDGDRVGRIQDIYLDAETDEPEWALVNTGLFGLKSTFVPISEARAEDDEVHVPFEKSVIKDAPGIEPEGELTESEEARLYDHYGFGGAGQAPAGTGGPDTRGTEAPPGAGVVPGAAAAAAAATAGRGDRRDERSGEPEDRVFVDQDARVFDDHGERARDADDLSSAPGAGPADRSGRGLGDERDEVVPPAAVDPDAVEPGSLGSGGGGFGESPVLSVTPGPRPDGEARDTSGPFGTGAAPIAAPHDEDDRDDIVDRGEAGERLRDRDRDLDRDRDRDLDPDRDREASLHRDDDVDPDLDRADGGQFVTARGGPDPNDRSLAGGPPLSGQRDAGGGPVVAPSPGLGEPDDPGLARSDDATPPPATDPAPPAERRRRLRRFVVTKEVIVNDRGEEEVVEVQREVPEVPGDPRAPRG
jgi:sporulation protein YlmC with PRC-barrel domain